MALKIAKNPQTEATPSVPAGAAKLKKTRAVKPKLLTPVVKPDNTHAVATFGVAFMAALSGLLNGYAHAQHAPSATAGWLLGLSIPVIVLVLGKVAGGKWSKQQRTLAKFTAGSGIALLVFSVWHCAESISMLTGSSLILSLPMALAIDCGLVACELAIVTEE